MKKLKKSRWVYTFRKGKNFALFHSKNFEIFFTDRDVVNILNFFNKPCSASEVFVFFKDKCGHKNLKNILDVLIKEKFVVSADSDELKEFKKWIDSEIVNKKNEFGKLLKLNALRVVLTEKCNMNCNYCFVRNGKKSESREMSFETLLRGINLLASLNKDSNIEIQFFGGEPLLRFDLIKKAVGYIKSLVKKEIIKNVYYGITTNGTLINNKIAKFLKENNFLVSVSIDGWQDLHDLNRRYFDKRGTFNDVVKGLKILQENKNDIGILITPAKNNIKYLAAACDYIIDRLKCGFIAINTPQPIKGNWDVSGKIFSKEIKKCFLVAKKRKAIINSFGTRVIYALNEKKPLVLSCSKFGDNYTATLTPDGKISPCIVSWSYKNMLAGMEKFSYSGKFSKWKLTPPFFFKKCFQCAAMNVCGGPCPLEIYEMNKFSKKIDHQRCNFFKDFLEWAIWLKE